MNVLTRRQREIYNYLLDNADSFNCPPSLDELCMRLGMASRGSLYKHIMALINAGLVEPFTGNKQAGIRLVSETFDGEVGSEGLPYVGAIAAGKPIEALETLSYMNVPDALKTNKPCYVLQVKGESMIDAGIHDGDLVIAEKKCVAKDGDIVIALIDGGWTMKYYRNKKGQVYLEPANKDFKPIYPENELEIAAIVKGVIRKY